MSAVHTAKLQRALKCRSRLLNGTPHGKIFTSRWSITSPLRSEMPTPRTPQGGVELLLPEAGNGWQQPHLWEVLLPLRCWVARWRNCRTAWAHCTTSLKINMRSWQVCSLLDVWIKVVSEKMSRLIQPSDYYPFPLAHRDTSNTSKKKIITIEWIKSDYWAPWEWWRAPSGIFSHSSEKVYIQLTAEQISLPPNSLSLWIRL